MTSDNGSRTNSVGQEASTSSDFSIDHILNRAGKNYSKKSENFSQKCSTNASFPLDPFSWLQCTRYCPPKIQRNQKREIPQKRQLGRHPRIPFTSHQLSVLEEKFQGTPYLTSEEVLDLAKKLHLADIRVKIWFQNRRARDRRERCSTSETAVQNLQAPNNPTEFLLPRTTTVRINDALTSTHLLQETFNYFAPVNLEATTDSII